MAQFILAILNFFFFFGGALRLTKAKAAAKALTVPSNPVEATGPAKDAGLPISTEEALAVDMAYWAEDGASDGAFGAYPETTGCFSSVVYATECSGDELELHEALNANGYPLYDGKEA